MATSRNVLIVEDDEAIRSSLKDILEVEGFNVFEAHNGKVALDVLRTCKECTLILLDLMMPEMNGYRFLEVMRQDEVIKAHPVVIMSASRDAALFAQQSLCAFLKKPLDVDELLKLVESELLRA
jgi:CheY-like chemotaxis protein